MILNRTEKVYPRQVIERIVGGQMRLVPEDGDLYENAVRNVYAAFDIAEQYTNRILVRSVVTFAFDRFESLLDLPTAPVLSIRSVKYFDADDREQTLDPSSYELLASEQTTALEIFTLPTLSTRRQRARVRIRSPASRKTKGGSSSPGTSRPRWRSVPGRSARRTAMP